MTRILLVGCNGRMGQVIEGLSKNDPNVDIAMGVDLDNSQERTYPIYKSIADCPSDSIDVILDFSLPSVTDSLLDYIEKTGLPAVICTTGLSDEQLQRMAELSKKSAILRSANMSLGINVLLKVLSEISPALKKAGFDIEVLERHHRGKKDAPSGTALALADAINGSLDENCDYCFDRSTRNEARPDNEIGISAMRGGTIPGDHEIVFAGEDEVLTLSHRAYSRNIFGKGALSAVKFLHGKGAGMYSMADVLA